MHQKLLTRDRLPKFGAGSDESCVLCSTDQESHEHQFCKCDFTTAVKDQILKILQVQNLPIECNC